MKAILRAFIIYVCPMVRESNWLIDDLKKLT